MIYVKVRSDSVIDLFWVICRNKGVNFFFSNKSNDY